MNFGPWMMTAFRVLAPLRVLRGTPLDIFGYSGERRMERRLIREFTGRIDEILSNLTPANHALAVGLATIPQKIRGFGHIKDRNLKTARAEEEQLLAQFRAPAPVRPLPLAAE